LQPKRSQNKVIRILLQVNASLLKTTRLVADLIGDTVDQVIKTYGHIYETDKKEIIGKIK